MSATSPDPSDPRRKDDPVRAVVPTFRAPPGEPEGTLTSGSPPDQPQGPAATAAPVDAPPLPGRVDQPSARTATSTTGDDGPAKPLSSGEITGLMVGVLGLVVTIAGAVVRWQARGRRLREPTATQTRAVAAPLGRILARRADLARLGPDIGDALQAAAAAGAYLGDGPLLIGDVVDDGVPPDLQEES